MYRVGQKELLRQTCECGRRAEPPSSAERHGALALVAIVVACREFLQRHGTQPSLKGHNRAVGHAKSRHCVGFLSQTVASALKCWRLVVE